MTSKTDREFLMSLGLNADGPALTKAHTESPVPVGVDPHTMPVSDIVFDPSLLDGFSLPSDRRQAADHIFALYKSPAKGDRNKLLWAEIGKFITKVMDQRKSGGLIKEKVKATAEERALAKILASQGITAEDLAALIQSKGA